MQYDANGNLTSDGVNTYSWDARNRLVSISGGTAASFAYDPLGRRASKTINRVSTQFAYDGNDVTAEIGGGAVGANYLRSLNIDEPFIRQSSTGNEQYHTDALGTTLALTNTIGASSLTYGYEPFGKATIAGTSANSFQYTERENDGTGLTYYRARYYSTVLQRFISQDPIGLRGGPNKYAYSENNPINFDDPLGLTGADRAQWAREQENLNRSFRLGSLFGARNRCNEFVARAFMEGDPDYSGYPRVLRENGYTYPIVSDLADPAFASNKLEYIPIDQVQPGDIVVWHDQSLGVHHTAISVGGGHVIYQNAELGVKRNSIDNVTNRYYGTPPVVRR